VSAPAADGRHLVELDDAECRRLLASRYVGRLGFVAGERPEIVPVNYVVRGRDVVIRLRAGAVSAAVDGAHVAFEIDDVDPDYHTGWSVVAHGRASRITDPDDLAAAEGLPLRAWAPGDRELYLRITTDHCTGRRIT
jgi:uncharacterized protein